MSHRLLKIWDRLEEWVLVILFLLLTVVTFSNVVARMSGGNILWAKELTQNLFAWLVIFGAAYCVREGSHIGIDAFVKRLADGKRHRVAIFSALIGLVYAFILFVGGVEAFLEDYHLDIEMEDMAIKEWVFKMILPIGFGLLTIRCGEVFYKLVTGKIRTLDLADEVSDVLDESIESEALMAPKDDNNKES